MKVITAYDIAKDALANNLHYKAMFAAMFANELGGHQWLTLKG
jgi:hypothetical protein